MSGTDGSIQSLVLKHKATRQKSILWGLSSRKCFYPHQHQKPADFPVPFFTVPPERSLFTGLGAPLSQGNSCSAALREAWQEGRAQAETETRRSGHPFQRAEVYHSGQDFHRLYRRAPCLELRPPEELFPL